MQVVCRRSFTHSAAQVPALISFFSWQPSAGQVVGQELRGSQVSAPSLAPLPQATEQSSSSLPVQPSGQQPSPLLHIVSFPASWQTDVHCSALPSNVNFVHPRDGQLAGQEVGGSQTSMGSTTPLPHWGWQSGSLAPVQPAGQQPSFISASQVAPHAWPGGVSDGLERDAGPSLLREPPAPPSPATEASPYMPATSL
jgi:hypothetical protein